MTFIVLPTIRNGSVVPKAYETKYGRLLVTPTDKLLGRLMDHVFATTHLKQLLTSKGV